MLSGLPHTLPPRFGNIARSRPSAVQTDHSRTASPPISLGSEIIGVRRQQNIRNGVALPLASKRYVRRLGRNAAHTPAQLIQTPRAIPTPPPPRTSTNFLTSTTLFNPTPTIYYKKSVSASPFPPPLLQPALFRIQTFRHRLRRHARHLNTHAANPSTLNRLDVLLKPAPPTRALEYNSRARSPRGHLQPRPNFLWLYATPTHLRRPDSFTPPRCRPSAVQTQGALRER
ncbi:hypothetical protein R3P38DRAFT_3223523 [Favolaschia claudopus]|uniref:Uncharacterized protein n=1 Tax=Favolaschia claudopus TaxID=2862362 RepID=A0AAV9ZWP7_9AGAR